jgi:hypothetical protein
MKYEIVNKVAWKEMREDMKEAETCKAKFAAFEKWLHSKRHHGEWEEETKVISLTFIGCQAGICGLLVAGIGHILSAVF